MIPDSNAISNVSTNLGHPDRTACYLLSVFQKYIYQCFLALGIRDLRLPITTCAISTALFLDTCTFLKAKQSYTISFQYNILSHTIGFHNPSSAGKDWNPVLESGIHGVEFRIQDCLGFPYIVRNLYFYVIIWATKMSVRLSNQ